MNHVSRLPVRSPQFRANTLKLMGTFPYEGEGIDFTITWTRIGASSK